MKQKNLIDILVAVVLMALAIGISAPLYGTDAYQIVSHSPYEWDTDSLEGTDTQSTEFWTDTNFVAGYYSDWLLEFDFVDADTALEFFFEQDSITFWVELYSGRTSTSLSCVYQESLTTLTDFHRWHDMIWLKNDPDDTIWGQWWSGKCWVKHWHANDTAWFATQFTKDSLKFGLNAVVMDLAR